MALSKRKTTVSVLRGILGPFHGREDRFARLAKRSRSWVKKVSAGVIPLSEETARLLELETGVALSWLMGTPEAPAVNGQGKPYSFAYFEWHCAGAKAGQPRIMAGDYPFKYVPEIAAVGSAAGDQGKASLFIWRLKTFLYECAKDFGFDEKARARAESIFKDAAKKTPELAEVAFHDKGLDVVVSAIKKSLKGKTAPLHETKRRKR